MTAEVAATRRRFTRAEYYRMAEVGILGEDDRVELIEGEIIEMSPIGSRHVAFVMNLGRLLTLGLGERAFVSIQSPVVLTDNTEPQTTSQFSARVLTRSGSRMPTTCSC